MATLRVELGFNPERAKRELPDCSPVTARVKYPSLRRWSNSAWYYAGQTIWQQVRTGL